MSFLNSVLSSIGTNSTSSPAQLPRSQPPKAPAAPSTVTSATTSKADSTFSKPNPSATNLKRKAEDNATSSSQKALKPDASTKSAPAPPAKNTTASNTSKPVNRTDRAGAVTKPSASISASAAATATKPAPKGSYREIMARAEAAKAAHGDWGKIKHQKKERNRLSRRAQREAMEAEAGGLKKIGGTTTSVKARPGMPSRTPSASDKMQMPAKEKRKPMEFAYKGTMRPSGTVPSKEPQRGKNRQSNSPMSYSDEAEDSYDSDESNMEAAGFDALEEEEQMSLRAAKKEDEEALRQESEHRRQKMEKRRKLEELVAARKKRAGQ